MKKKINELQNDNYSMKPFMEREREKRKQKNPHEARLCFLFCAVQRPGSLDPKLQTVYGKVRGTEIGEGGQKFLK